MDYEGSIETIWNAEILSDDGAYCIGGLGHNAVLASGESTDFGFIASGEDHTPNVPVRIGFNSEFGGVTLGDGNG